MRLDGFDMGLVPWVHQDMPRAIKRRSPRACQGVREACLALGVDVNPNARGRSYTVRAAVKVQASTASKDVVSGKATVSACTAPRSQELCSHPIGIDTFEEEEENEQMDSNNRNDCRDIVVFYAPVFFNTQQPTQAGAQQQQQEPAVVADAATEQVVVVEPATSLMVVTDQQVEQVVTAEPGFAEQQASVLEAAIEQQLVVASSHQQKVVDVVQNTVSGPRLPARKAVAGATRSSSMAKPRTSAPTVLQYILSLQSPNVMGGTILMVYTIAAVTSRSDDGPDNSNQGSSSPSEHAASGDGPDSGGYSVGASGVIQSEESYLEAPDVLPESPRHLTRRLIELAPGQVLHMDSPICGAPSPTSTGMSFSPPTTPRLRTISASQASASDKLLTAPGSPHSPFSLCEFSPSSTPSPRQQSPTTPLSPQSSVPDSPVASSGEQMVEFEVASAAAGGHGNQLLGDGLSSMETLHQAWVQNNQLKPQLQSLVQGLQHHMPPLKLVNTKLQSERDQLQYRVDNNVPFTNLMAMDGSSDVHISICPSAASSSSQQQLLPPSVGHSTAPLPARQGLNEDVTAQAERLLLLASQGGVVGSYQQLNTHADDIPADERSELECMQQLVDEQDTLIKALRQKALKLMAEMHQLQQAAEQLMTQNQELRCQVSQAPCVSSIKTWWEAASSSQLHQ